MVELKHPVSNNQESIRTAINETIDQRTLHEIYELPFEAAVKIAQPAAIICAFTSVNRTHSCQNKAFERGAVEDQWGFDGFFQYESQWVNYLGGSEGAQFSCVALMPAPELKNYDGAIVSGGAGSQYKAEAPIVVSPCVSTSAS